MLAWRDTLQEGPVPALPPAELRGVRAEFIAARGWAPRDAAEADLRARDEALAAALGSEPVVLWFEHDLYDQLQLIQILARVGDEPVEAILPDRFLGSLSAGDLAALWPDRRPVTPRRRSRPPAPPGRRSRRRTPRRSRRSSPTARCPSSARR